MERRKDSDKNVVVKDPIEFCFNRLQVPKIFLTVDCSGKEEDLSKKKLIMIHEPLCNRTVLALQQANIYDLLVSKKKRKG